MATAIELRNPALDGTKASPKSYGSKECSPRTSTRAGEKGFNNSRGLRSQVKAPHTREWQKLEGQRGESAVLDIEIGGTGMAQMTSPRLLQANTTLMAGSEIQCMVTGGKSRDKWG